MVTTSRKGNRISKMHSHVSLICKCYIFFSRLGQDALFSVIPSPQEHYKYDEEKAIKIVFKIYTTLSIDQLLTSAQFLIPHLSTFQILFSILTTPGANTQDNCLDKQPAVTLIPVLLFTFVNFCRSSSRPSKIDNSSFDMDNIHNKTKPLSG